MLLVSRTLVFDRFRFKLPTRELLRVAEDGSEMPIPLGLRAADVLLFFLERPGELVTKSEIMQAVWPDVVVEESNLTVHISAIRRAIDDGRDGESCIQNVPRRGYRFTLGVTPGGAAADGQSHGGLPDAPQDAQVRPASSASLEALAAAPVVTASANTAGRLIRNWRVHAAAAAAVLLVAAGTIAFVGRETPALLQPVQPAEPHLASIVALPFANASGDPKDEELAAALTEDVTVSLDQIPGAYVIARSMAQTMAARKLPLSRIGSELRVRYVLEGNIRRSPDGLELNVELSEAASGASIWTRQVKGSAGEPSDLRSQVARDAPVPIADRIHGRRGRQAGPAPDCRTDRGRFGFSGNGIIEPSALEFPQDGRRCSEIGTRSAARAGVAAADDHVGAADRSANSDLWRTRRSRGAIGPRSQLGGQGACAGTRLRGASAAAGDHPACGAAFGRSRRRLHETSASSPGPGTLSRRTCICSERSRAIG